MVLLNPLPWNAEFGGVVRHRLVEPCLENSDQRCVRQSLLKGTDRGNVGGIMGRGKRNIGFEGVDYLVRYQCGTPNASGENGLKAYSHEVAEIRHYPCFRGGNKIHRMHNRSVMVWCVDFSVHSWFIGDSVCERRWRVADPLNTSRDQRG